MRVLLLGGTSEARALADRLHPRVSIVSSLAGRVPDPALPIGPVRVGGFGGAEGLRKWLLDNDINAVVDATHPFAAAITATAAGVCADLDVPHVVLHRPPWESGHAIGVAGNEQAAEAVAGQGFSRVFLTTGRSGTTVFRASRAWFLIRVVTAPDAVNLPQNHQLILSRGPYRYDSEAALLRDHGIDVLVTKNSGGALTRAKVDAAIDLGVPVVMIERPPLPNAVTAVDSVEAAADWVLGLGAQLG